MELPFTLLISTHNERQRAFHKNRGGYFISLSMIHSEANTSRAGSNLHEAFVFISDFKHMVEAHDPSSDRHPLLVIKESDSRDAIITNNIIIDGIKLVFE